MSALNGALNGVPTPPSETRPDAGGEIGAHLWDNAPVTSAPPSKAAPSSSERSTGVGKKTGSVDPMHPGVNYQVAQTAFTNQFSHLARGKRNWQLLAFLMTGLVVLLSISTVTLILSSRVVPYIVEVDKLGVPQAFGPAEPLRQTDQRIIIAQLADFTRSIRAVYTDPVSQREALTRAFAYTDQQTSSYLTKLLSDPDQDPRLLGKRMNRTVEVRSIIQIPNTDTYRVQWLEREAAPGSPPDPYKTPATWEGLFGVKVQPPTQTDQIERNPMGLYVTSINWQKVSGPTLIIPEPASKSQPEASEIPRTPGIPVSPTAEPLPVAP